MKKVKYWVMMRIAIMRYEKSMYQFLGVLIKHELNLSKLMDVLRYKKWSYEKIESYTIIATGLNYISLNKNHE